LDHNGRILQDHYLDPFKLRDLIDHGDVSILGSEIGVQRPFDNPHKWGTPEYESFSTQYQNQCLFYHRDRGEDHHVSKFKDFAEYERTHQYEEYEYILRQINGGAVWFVSSYDTDGYVELAPLLAKKAA
jgi:hypothetical protein